MAIDNRIRRSAHTERLVASWPAARARSSAAHAQPRDTLADPPSELSPGFPVSRAHRDTSPLRSYLTTSADSAPRSIGAALRTFRYRLAEFAYSNSGLCGCRVTDAAPAGPGTGVHTSIHPAVSMPAEVHGHPAQHRTHIDRITVPQLRCRDPKTPTCLVTRTLVNHACGLRIIHARIDGGVTGEESEVDIHC